MASFVAHNLRTLPMDVGELHRDVQPIIQYNEFLTQIGLILANNHMKAPFTPRFAC